MNLEIKIVLESGEFISDLQRDVVKGKVFEISDYLDKVIKFNSRGSNATQKKKKR